MIRTAVWLLAGLVAMRSVPAVAQERARSSCPASGVVALRADGLPQAVPERALRASIDTVYDLAIDQKRWTASDLAGSVAVGVTGMERASWTACAGAWVSIRRADVLVENVRGSVRLRASIAPLMETLRRHSADPQSNPNRDDR